MKTSLLKKAFYLLLLYITLFDQYVICNCWYKNTSNTILNMRHTNNC